MKLRPNTSLMVKLRICKRDKGCQYQIAVKEQNSCVCIHIYMHNQSMCNIADTQMLIGTTSLTFLSLAILWASNFALVFEAIKKNLWGVYTEQSENTTSGMLRCWNSYILFFISKINAGILQSNTVKINLPISCTQIWMEVTLVSI